MALTIVTNRTTMLITGTTATPVTIFGVQNGTNLSLPFLPTRIVWVDPGGSAGDTVIGQSLPGFGGTAAPDEIFYFVASISNFMPPQEWKPSGHAAGWQGFVIARMDGGRLSIFQ